MLETKTRIRWANAVEVTFLFSVVILIITKFVFASVFYGLLGLIPLLGILYISPFRTDLRYYLFFLTLWFLSFLFLIYGFSLFIFVIVFLALFFIIIMSLWVKRKGVVGEVVQSGKDYSVVFIEFDLFSFVKPGYYMIKEKIKKGTKVRIRSVDNSVSGLITRFEII